MNKVQKTLIAAALTLPVLPLGGTAQAAPVFGQGLNEIFFNNFENVYRQASPNDNPMASDGVTPLLLAFDPANDPVGYRKPNAFVSNNIQPGDVFAGIFNVQNIDNEGSTIWFSGPTDQFSGYFAQEVVSVESPDSWDAAQILDHIVLTNPAVDPFGILAAGEMFRFYVDNAATVFESNGVTFDDITKATDGALWASLGTGDVGADGAIDPDGYMYSHVDLDLTLDNIAGAAFAGLNFVTPGSGFNLGAVRRINDVNENEVGGVATPPLSGICAGLGPIACNDIVGSGELEANPRSTEFQGNSPWIFASNDPFLVYVPEPGTVALMGLGLLGLAVGARRRKSA